MIQCLCKASKEIACILLTFLYCQTVLSAYKPWRECQVITSKWSIAENFSSEKFNNITHGVVKNEINSSSISTKFHTQKIQFNKKESEKSGKVGGPTQPEMTAFKSVNDNNMVDLFSGNFSYNIPLLDVGGYPVNLFYQSGITMDQEASWVGLGWNINPGTITRNLRGIPDDFDGKNDIVQKITSTKENKTIGADIGGDLEFTGIPKALNIGVNAGAFYNNYRGWGLEYGLDASICAGFGSMGSLSGGLSIVNNSQQGLTISPSLGAGLEAKMTTDNGVKSGSVSIGGGFAYNSRSGLATHLSTGVSLSMAQNDSKTKDKKDYSQDFVNSSLYGSYMSFASPSYNPSASIPFTNSQFTFTGKVGGAFFATFGNLYLKGYVSKQFIDPSDVSRSFPAYGYLYYQDANSNPQALLDFNREKDIVYREKPEVPNIAIPAYTYDLFGITGEGSGGMFRIYRGDIGSVHDPYVTTKDQSNALSGDVGFGELFHAGLDLNQNHAVTTNGVWSNSNPLLNTVKFKQSDSVFEAAYLRNVGEKSINAKDFYSSIGDDDVVTAQLYQAGNGPVVTSTNNLQHWKNKTASNISTVLNSATAFKSKRDKRSQVISYLTAGEASRAGLDTLINNYGLNKWGSAQCSDSIQHEQRVNSFRQANHMSEIDVLNNDGRRYVYGLPVYNLIQKEITFAVDPQQTNKTTGMIKYNASTDISPGANNHGIDNYIQEEITPAYAHSFLLTGILSPDYVDVTGNGISEDDIGDAIRFNYTKVAGQGNAFGWRTPYTGDSATYNEGLQTYIRDDRASYIYGQKEMWYMNSIESKNMIAIFILQSRSDLASVNETASTKDTSIAKSLKEIDLYSKSDYLLNGAKAKPIKTVHFFYTYDLCKNINGNTSKGKLTLKKIWFSYNGNEKVQKNPYTFFYNTSNPDFVNGTTDRWGNYKYALQNPRSSQSNIITNAEYPYAIQDKNIANNNAAAWTMDSVVLPSSGSIKVGYESDEYAYVQNKRAMQMFNVVGLSNASPTSFYNGSNSLNNLSNYLYDLSSKQDKLYVGIRVTSAVTSSKDVFQKYLDGFQKIYFKLKVQVPPDEFGSGYEYVPVYGDLDINSIADSSNYGVLSGKPDIIWFKLKSMNRDGTDGGDYSPLAEVATQFLRLNLPSKAYPGYEVGDKLDIDVAVRMIGALGKNIVHAFSSFDDEARNNGWVVNIDTARTLVRLDNPVYRKYGGGLRVKFIKIYDNWKNMTDSSSQSVYGQVYDYTTVKNINGVDTKISSGVASWEPMLGGEENPFIIPLEYTEKVAPLAPVTLGYTELPLGSTFFPAPSVGYSQVRVSSIHSTNIKSATGYQETKFYTSYDFPTITDNSLFTPDTKKRYKTSLTDFLRIRSFHYLTMSQGFKIELNDMNGKIKSESSYSQTDSLHPIASSTYYYHVDDQNAQLKHLNNSVKTVDSKGVIDTGTTIGKDIELMVDTREQRSLTEGVDHGINADVFTIFLFPIVIPSNIPMPQEEETRFQSVAITKVINRTGILDSVVAIDKGSKVSTDNLLYDSETGDVLLTRTRNEFNDTLYNFSYPAHWAYSGMGQAYQNISAVYNHLRIVNGVLQSNSNYPGMLNRFESGDELFASGKMMTGLDSSSAGCSGSGACPTPVFSSNYDVQRVWAINTKKLDSSNSLGIVFIDRNGNPFSADDVSLKIIRSGHRNLSTTTIGALTMMHSPIKTVSGKLQLVIDSNKNVLNSNAISFNDKWKVEDAMYLKDSAVATMLDTTIILNPYSATNFMRIEKATGDAGDSYNANANNILAGYEHYDNHHSCNSIGYQYKTALLFDFSKIPYQSQIVNAGLLLTVKTPSDFVYNTNGNGDLYCSGPYNWSSASGFYLNASQTLTYIQRITGNWSNNTAFNSIPTTTIHQANASYTGYQNIGCTNLIQDVVNNSQQYGLMFQFAKTSNTSNDEQEYLNFCANSLNGCSAPSLTVEYLHSGYIHYYVCRSAVTQRNINLYVYGILGNWRSDKSYVYYGNRKENTTSNTTDIRNNGIIQNFITYWSFGTNYLVATTDTSTYVWNATSTLYNRKGFEIENKDPLGRYNSGIYGYNESLPISVTQNGKYKDQFFDGFEDYIYSTQTCSQNCPVPRNIDFTQNGGVLTNTVAHSGKYSLQVAAASSAFQKFQIKNADDSGFQKVYAIVNATQIIDTIVSLKGAGGFNTNSSQSHINHYDNYIQASTSGTYVIQISSIGYVQSSSPNVTQGYQFSVGSSYVGQLQSGGQLTVYLYAGSKTEIQVDAFENSYFTSAPSFRWQKSDPCGFGFTNVPSANLYISSAADGSVTYDSTFCASKLQIKTDSSSLIPTFKPTQNSQMVFSAWVKEQRNCLCEKYDSNAVSFTFSRTSHSDTVLTFKPSGTIIEGWQRYDTVITIPAGATSMRLALKSLGSSPIYFDDVRMLPYNANMKSFVYDPVSLRLMAELDENNYATFYEYDDDGTLTRVKKETERGIQTIKETRSFMSKMNNQ